jgi:hypothetical protein
MNSVRKQDKALRRFATIMAALVVLASSAASQRADSSRAASSRSIATSHAQKKSSCPKALPSAGPSPVNQLAVGQYQTNDHGTYASRQEVEFAPSTAGSRTADLTVIDNAKTSPQSVPLLGKGSN